MKKINIAIALCVSLSANAEVFKCVDARGKTVYQGTPCLDNKGYFIDLEKGTNTSVEEYKKIIQQSEQLQMEKTGKNPIKNLGIN